MGIVINNLEEAAIPAGGVIKMYVETMSLSSDDCDEILLPKLVRLHNLNDFLLLPPSSISLFSFALLFMHAYGLPKICIDSCLHVFLSFIARCSDSERE